jgi:hypothetical protein
MGSFVGLFFAQRIVAASGADAIDPFPLLGVAVASIATTAAGAVVGGTLQDVLFGRAQKPTPQ